MMGRSLFYEVLVFLAQTIALELEVVDLGRLGRERGDLALDIPPLFQHGLGQLLVWHVEDQSFPV
jgi:hypothetical protein